MPDFIFGKLFQLVRCPMPKIERPRGTEFERVSGSGDMIEMQLRATINQSLHCGRLECGESFRISFESLKEFPVANERDLHCLDVTGASVSRRQGVEQLKIIHHGERGRESSDEILFAKRVDSVLHTYTGVRLAQSRARNADMPYAPVGGGGG